MMNNGTNAEEVEGRNTFIAEGRRRALANVKSIHMQLLHGCQPNDETEHVIADMIEAVRQHEHKRLGLILLSAAGASNFAPNIVTAEKQIQIAVRDSAVQFLKDRAEWVRSELGDMEKLESDGIETAAEMLKGWVPT